MKSFLYASAATFAAGAVVLSVAFAQDDTQTDNVSTMMGGDCPTMGMMGHGMRHGGKGRRHWMGQRGRMGAMAEGRLAYLKSALDITDAQETAWQDYADAVKLRVGAMQSMHAGMMSAMQDGGAVERMEARISGMEAMVEAMKAVKPATEALYGVLSDDQKTKADELIGLGCGGM